MSIYQHFRIEERIFVDQVLDWKQDVIVQYTYKLTDFLDPREQDILKTIIGKDEEISLSFWGGASSTERKRAMLFPSYFELAKNDFQIQAFELRYPRKFITLEHRDILGSIMGLGMKREKFGDILITDEVIQVLVANEVASFIELNLQKVGQAKVKIVPINEEDIIENVEEWTEESTTISSLRLDTLLSAIYNISRTKSSLYIDRGLVKVNWKTIEDGAFQVQEGDYLSVRNFGRSKLLSIAGSTKKGKIRIVFGRKK
ncbi:RNA-binding protein [Alkalihalobacterium alkalinitrilicum]|uniref:YlmH family RNA-binding protein n=1 Tax=Alkalihalobacterium alkalinitrilicum TaxID=427920 RepID=UPI000994FA86|nr:RNA-binding protein [Alkalihalobacterium alkalinitrilicum]